MISILESPSQINTTLIDLREPIFGTGKTFLKVLNVARLINPCKSDLGRISKHILDKLLKSIKNSKQNLNQFTSTDSALKWFEGLTNTYSGIISFDIVSFYPSITEETLVQALDFAESLSPMEPNDRDVIMSARKSILFFQDNPWCKKGDSFFDVTMGCPDGAEVCELIGLFLLNELEKSKIIDSSEVGLYRDDGIAVLRGTKRDGENLRKKITKLFKKFGFGLEVSPVGTFLEFLDVRLDLKEREYEVYIKPNTKTQYVNMKSNHPPAILKNLPQNTENRINKRCSTQTLFEKHAPRYNDILKRSGYNQTINYCPPTQPLNYQPPKKSRTRKVIWFNPPYCRTVKTNIGHEFLRLLEEFFPKTSPYRRFFNKNTVKVSYCTMGNVKSLINGHNKKQKLKFTKIDQNDPKTQNSQNSPKTQNKTTTQTSTTTPKTCNCRDKNNCPVSGTCLLTSCIYEATLTHESGKEKGEKYTYIGLAGNTFKDRYNGHKSSLTHLSSGQTTLSTYHHKLDKKGVKHKIEWQILEDGLEKWNGKNCQLCDAEKRYILFSSSENQLNARSEIRSMCRHMNKFGEKRGRKPGTKNKKNDDSTKSRQITTKTRFPGEIEYHPDRKNNNRKLPIITGTASPATESAVHNNNNNSHSKNLLNLLNSM